MSFLSRHIGPDADDLTTMLGAVGAESLDQLIDRAVPESIRMRESLDLPEPLDEPEALSALRRIASRNTVTVSYTHLDVYKRQVQDRAHRGCAARQAGRAGRERCLIPFGEPQVPGGRAPSRTDPCYSHAHLVGATRSGTTYK